MRNEMVAALLAVILIGSFSTSLSANAMNESTSAGRSPESVAFSFYFLSVGQASCSLSTGVCEMAIANEGTNSSYDLVLAGNHCTLLVIYFKNSNVTKWIEVNGTVGGQILTGLPHLTNEIATCTVPTARIANYTNGDQESGFLTMKTVNSGPIPPGTTARVQINGIWSASTPPNTITTTSTVTVTTTNVLTSTLTLASTTTQTSVTTVQSTGAPTNDVSTVALGGLLAVALAALLLSRRKPV